MKIGIVLPGTFAVGNPFNGVREQAFFQADALEDLGHEVIRMTPWEKYDLEAFDIVHFFCGGPSSYMIENRTPTPIRSLVFAPIIDAKYSNISYRFAKIIGSLHPRVLTVPGLFATHANASRLVIARSTQEKNRLVRGLNVDPTKIEIVLNGAPRTSSSDPDLARQFYGLTEDFVFHVSRYTSTNKNVENLIHGVAKAGYPLVIGGTHDEGSNHSRIKAAAEKHGNVRFLGRLSAEHRDSLYAACRVFCLPSRFEGTGLVALEAASQGASIVITHNGGPPDYFLHHAEYVTKGDVQDIHDATKRAWEKPRTEELRRHVAENLTWERSAQSLVRAYRKHCNPNND